MLKVVASCFFVVVLLRFDLWFVLRFDLFCICLICVVFCVAFCFAMFCIVFVLL